jgi:hypothetical protein
MTRPRSAAVEKSTDAQGALSGTKTSMDGATAQTSTPCEPVGLAELAVLALPALFLISPLLKGFNMAGLVGIDFRDFQEKVVQEAKEQIIRVIIERETGEKTQTALAQAAEGEVSPLPEA